MLVGVGLLAHHYPTNCPAGGIPLLLPSFVVPTHASQQAGGASDGLWSSCLDEHQVGMPGMRSICQLAVVAGSQPVAAIPNFLLQHPMQPQPLCSLGTVALSEQACWRPAGIKYMVCLCGLALCFLASTILEAWLTREGLKGGRRVTAPVQPASHAQFNDPPGAHAQPSSAAAGASPTARGHCGTSRHNSLCPS